MHEASVSDQMRIGFPGTVLLLATLVAPLVSVWIVRRYQRAVAAAMAVASRAPVAGHSVGQVPTLEKVEGLSERDVSERGSQRARRSAVVLQVVAGVVFACTAGAVFTYLLGTDFELRTAALYSLFLAFPIVPAVAHVTGDHRRAMIGAGFFAVALVIATAIAMRGTGENSIRVALVIGALVWIPPGLLAWLMTSRRFRCVGPIVWLAAVTLVGLVFLPLYPGFPVLSGMVALSLTFALVFLSLLAIWLAFRGAAYAYRKKFVGDLTIALDVHWLIYTTWSALIGLGIAYGKPPEGTHLLEAAWVFAAFVGYVAVHRAGLAWIRARRTPSPSRSLLLLRVFGHSARSERLLDELSGRWRYLGCINLIAGPDVAATTLDLPELFDFATGRLATNFVSSGANLQRRLNTLDELPDPDGRFRINEFFCHDDTWRITVRALAQRSEAVLMDLRAFSQTNKGCVAELEMLLECVPPERVTIVVDGTTDLTFLDETLATEWSKLVKEDPTRNAQSPRFRTVCMAKGNRAEVRSLIASLVGSVNRERIAPQVAVGP